MHTITARDPSDLIAYAYYRIGFRPRESLVLIGLTQPLPAGADASRLRSGAVIRLDLPAAGSRRPAFERSARLLVEHGHDAALALLVTQRPSTALNRGVSSALRAADLPLIDLIVIGHGSYRSALCRDPRCCPAAGEPLGPVFTGPAAAAMVVQGYALAESPEDLVADVLPGDESPWQEPLLADPPEPVAARLGRVERWAELVAAVRPGAGERFAQSDLVDLCLGLDDVRLRDAVLVAMSAPTGPDGLDAARLMASGEADAALADSDRHEPDAELLERSRAVLAAIARRAPRGRRAEALGALAWAAWWQGDAVRARLLAERALDDSPAHRLSELVLGLLGAHVAPPWLARRRQLIS